MAAEHARTEAMAAGENSFMAAIIAGEAHERARILQLEPNGDEAQREEVEARELEQQG